MTANTAAREITRKTIRGWQRVSAAVAPGCGGSAVGSVSISTSTNTLKRSKATQAAQRSTTLPPPQPLISILRSSDTAALQRMKRPAPNGWRKCIVSHPSFFSASAALDLADITSQQLSSSINNNDNGRDMSASSIGQAQQYQSGSGSSFSSSSSSTSSVEQQQDLIEVDMDELQNLAKQRCTPLKLVDMYKYAVDFNNEDQRLLNAQFLHKELPIRLAQRAVDLLTLPHGLSDAMPIREVAHDYLKYLEQFQDFPVPTTLEEEEKFTEMLRSMVLDRSSIPNALSRGVAEWVANEKREDLELTSLQDMEDALYRFFTARVGLRFLAEHHILSDPRRIQDKYAKLKEAQSSFHDKEDTDNIFLGCIQTDCDPVKEIRKVCRQVARQTEEHFGICPEIQIIDCCNNPSKFTYVPHHLHYMVGELVKNSCRATVRRFNEVSDPNAELPRIRVVIAKGEEDVTIKICDRGGGIPRSKLAKVWKFAHSTASAVELESEFGVDEVTGTKIRGFGLPLSRIYARYLGGELTLKSTEGHGLDAYLHLPRLGDSCENLPLSVVRSPGDRVSLPPRQILERDGSVRGFSTIARSHMDIGVDINGGGCDSQDVETTDEKIIRIMRLLKQRAL